MMGEREPMSQKFTTDSIGFPSPAMPTPVLRSMPSTDLASYIEASTEAYDGIKPSIRIAIVRLLRSECTQADSGDSNDRIS